ncbi:MULTISPECIES: single-stranded DNA-binding protein [Streptacidiphilus]|uniref:Single-stranded DNA-binding protein n=1 Tax=Streptacidiphilus cavernicola TaxID=3342716 RepID=A0ABV6UWE6_9ACTN|nr:single-stranded DNA-binding protein [Streptacidiphilus jeojiense]
MVARAEREVDQGGHPRVVQREVIRHHTDVRALAAHTAADLHGERDHLASLAHRTGDPGLLDIAVLAHRLAQDADAIGRSARADRQRQGADRARTALRTAPAGNTAATLSPQFAAPPTARAEPVAAPAVLTGTLTRGPELRTADGMPVARLQIALDPNQHGAAHLMVVTLTGHAARSAAACHLALGARVVLAGTQTLHHYTRADGIPHSAVSFNAIAFGPDLTHKAPLATAR